MDHQKAPRRFAPLDPDKNGGSAAPPLRGIVFDVDGTLCLPQNYMFAQMRTVLAIPKSTDILDHISSLPLGAAQDSAHAAIRAIEAAAMLKQEPQEGVGALMAYLARRGVRKGICTRNFDMPVTHLLTTFLHGHDFGPIVTREFRPPKPHPAGILHIASQWGLEDGGNGLIMVGDSIDDMTAGFRAGAATVLLVNEANAHLATHEHTDSCVGRLDELIPILEGGFEGGVGEGTEGAETKARAEGAG